MNIDELKNLLDKQFIEVYKNILINGDWGIGKTYFIKEYLKDKNNTIYIQLFGIDSIENLKLNLYMQINKITGFLKKANKTISGINLSNSFASLSIPYFEGEITKSLEKKSKKENLIIVIDDLERKSSNISMEDLLGIIEEFSKIKNTYIILIANETEIAYINEKDYKIYSSFKEKIVQKTFNITNYSNSARKNIIKSTLNEIDNIENQEDILIYIESFLSKHRILNLRTIEKSMKFLKFILCEVDLKELKKIEIKAIIVVALSIVIEKIKNLNYKESDKKDNISQWNTDDLTTRVIVNYLKELPLISDKKIIVKILIDIYDDIEMDNNFKKLINYFKSEQSENSKEKSLFYKSKEELKKYIQEFYNSSILNVNQYLDIDMWLKKFAEVNYYAVIINNKNWYKEDEIEKAIDKYVENISDIQLEVKNNVYRLVHLNQYKDSTIEEICELINQKIYNKYIDNLIYQIAEKKKENKYDEQLIENLFEIYTIKNGNSIQKIIDALDENNFFLPNLNENLSEESWGVTHAIWNNMQNTTEKRDNKFELFVQELLKSSDEIGTYRITSLNKYSSNIL